MRMVTEFFPQKTSVSAHLELLPDPTLKTQLFSLVTWFLSWLIKRTGNSHQVFSGVVKNSDRSEEDGSQTSTLHPARTTRRAHLRPLGLGCGCEKKCSFLINNKCHEAISPSCLARDSFSPATGPQPLREGGPKSSSAGQSLRPPLTLHLPAAAAAVFEENGGRQLGKAPLSPMVKQVLC